MVWRNKIAELIVLLFVFSYVSYKHSYDLQIIQNILIYIDSSSAGEGFLDFDLKEDSILDWVLLPLSSINIIKIYLIKERIAIHEMIKKDMNLKE